MNFKFAATLSLLLFSMPVMAQDVEKPTSKNIEISIYNNNLALVKDLRETSLKEGINDVAFEGVASNIKPESVIILGDEIHVLEQNYDYALLTPYNIAEKSVGQKVKTLRINPATGKQVLDEAKLISYQNGEPILEFSYGIETNFDGRLVFEKMPESLMQKPTLAAKISSQSNASKELTLAYLTNGISWKTNYVASIIDENTLDLAGWVSINNNSGVSYENAKVQLIAGQVNEVPAHLSAPRNMVQKAAMYADQTDSLAMGASVQPESFSAYQLYTLPHRTTINNNQTKQISLIEKSTVTYQKEGRVRSPLYFDGEYASNFEKVHPAVYYILVNNEASNLGIPLPKGVFRFYENDLKGNMQFIGENTAPETAKGEEIELELGKMFDVFLSGKALNVRKISEEVISDANGKCPRLKIVRAYDVQVVFTNGGNKETVVVFKQPLSTRTQILNENIKGEISKKNANEYQWRILLSADSAQTLTFTAQTTNEETRCR